MSTNKLDKKLTVLLAKQQQLFNRMQLAYNLAVELENDINDPIKLKPFQIRCMRLAETRIEFRDIVQEIVNVKQEINPDEPPNYNSLDSFEDLYDFVEYVSKQTSCVRTEVKPVNVKPRMIHMPKIELIKFNGDDISLWPLFYENFKGLIHVNTDFSSAEKLQYLLGSLEGKALKCCSSIDPIPDHYEVIWNLLEQNYQNKRFLAGCYFDKLMNFRPIVNDNPNSLQTFLEKFDTNVSALKRLQLDDLSDFILTYIALSKLPQNVVNNFELLKNNDEIPQYEDLMKFIRHQSKLVVKSEKSRPSHNFNQAGPSSKFSKTFVAKENIKKNCVACKNSPHLLIHCKSFQDFSPEKRYQIVKDNNLCLNCFSSKHHIASCCSKFTCKECHSKHHTLLHRKRTVVDKRSPKFDIKSESNIHAPEHSSKDVTQTLCTTTTLRSNLVLLSTVVVKITDKWNREQNLRFLLDSGSVSNLITWNSCKRLGLPVSKYFSSVSGVGGSTSPIKGKTQLVCRSNINSDFVFSVVALVVDRITNSLPDMPVDTKNLDYLNSLPLADPSYHTPGNVDGILSASIFAEILRSGRVTGPPGTPTAIQTAIGYVIFGDAPILEHTINQSVSTHCSFLTLESLVERMWNLEDFSPSTPSVDDELCENIFVRNHKRDSTGRYIVPLPFKDDPAQLGNSYSLAIRRFQSLERRFEKSPELKEMYTEIIRDYLHQGHMVPICDENTVKPSYYIPHHCVFKLNSTSTPCRIVFDSSAKTVSNSNQLVSLNDLLFSGPKLQNNIFTVLLNFRLFPIALTADLKNMFRQIRIVDEHHRFQRILWRFNPNEPISTYELTRVSFGVRSSPYLSLRTIKQLVRDEGDSYPQAAIYADRDMYVDDLVCSVPTLEEAKILQTQLVELFASGGFPLVKWSSNSPELLSQIPDHMKIAKSFEFEDTLPVLGLQWSPCSDEFSFVVNSRKLPCTKRNILSSVARIFDPHGYLAPIVLQMKLLIKDLWKMKYDWDDEAPLEIQNLWCAIQSEFELLNSIKLPRFALCKNFTSVSLIGFCDASQVALGAVVFVRVIDTQNQVHIALLCAQSKVAAMQSITLPRLELNAAVLLAKLIAHVRDTYSSRIKIDNIYAFSDSMISLAWIHSEPKRWQIYIANRISKIHRFLPAPHWYFIPGKFNVADCISRGLSPSNLLKFSVWFLGPAWLYEATSQWPIQSFDKNEVANFKDENLVFVVKPIVRSPLYSLIEYFSTWSKMLNSMVYVLRFAKKLPKSDHISASDLNEAEMYLLRVVQQNHFSSEFTALSKNLPVSNKIIKLNPFIQDGLIRVGGRLSNANLSFDVQHPILLPKLDPLVVCLIDYTHRLNCHAGPHLTLSLLRQKYWILAARDVVRRRVWACNHCFKTRPKPTLPLMADLPSPRVNQYKAFLHTGVDFTGSFLITMSKHRGVKTQKAYVCLFICLTTKAVHLELASDLSTEAFILAFKRFISRRGNCDTIYSDNGTNFVGAKAQFDDIYRLVNSEVFKDNLQNEFNIRRITWKFNPPSASHFGGIWESNIKSVETHLLRVIGSQILTFEEFSTVLVQIEALLNSRPLCCLSADPSEPTALTPSHFLYGAPLNNLPSQSVLDQPISRLTRYKLLDSLVQSYWKRWHVEYLTTLQIRQKWNSPTNPIKVGTVCIIISNNLPPLQWPLAVVLEIYPGKDGVIRVVLVKTKQAQYVRPVAKLCPLPTQ